MGNKPIVKNPIDFDRFLVFRLHRLATRLGQYLPNFKELGYSIGVREWRVMAVLGSYGHQSIAEIAEFMSYDHPTTSRAVSRLLELGYVEAIRSRLDKRRKIVRLTKEGARVHDVIAPVRIQAVKEIEKKLSAADRKKLYEIFDALDLRFTTLNEQLETLGESDGAW